MYKDWVLDITHVNDENFIPCFCPVNGDTVVFGLSMLQSKCPGNLVGIFHSSDNDKAQKWIDENPGWYEKYCSDTEEKNGKVDA